jgi:ribosomal-protein-alanine N-acetyltransferase
MTTSRIIIRPPNLEDCEAFLKAVQRSTALHHPYIYPPDTAEAFKQYVNRLTRSEYVGRLVCLRQSGEIAGVINLNDIIRGSFQSASLGYYAFVPFAGQGLMREGLQLMLQYAFQELQLHRIEANIQPENTASIALVKQCGFSKEGFSKRYLKIGGDWRDHERWALVVEDWEETPGRCPGLD